MSDSFLKQILVEVLINTQWLHTQYLAKIQRLQLHNGTQEDELCFRAQLMGILTTEHVAAIE